MSTVFVMVWPHKGAPIPKQIRDFRNKVHVWMEGALGMKLAKIASDHPNEIFSKERGMFLINCNTTSNDSDPSHVYVCSQMFELIIFFQIVGYFDDVVSLPK